MFDSDIEEIDVVGIACDDTITDQEDFTTCPVQRSRKHLSIDAKSIIINVYNNLLIRVNNCASALQETATLTQIPLSSVRDIVNKGATQRSKRCDSNVIRCLDNFDIDVIRREIYEMYRNNFVPTIESLQRRLRANTTINISKTTVYNVLKELGFHYKKIDRRQCIMDSPRLVKHRYEYLTSIKQFRQEGRYICFLDETWFDTHAVVKKGWTDKSDNCVLDVPPSRGKRIIILHAGGIDGWVGEYLLSAKNVSDSSLDYHEDMTAQLFEDWFENKLIPALPKNSIIVMDNASYHSRQIVKIPTTNSKKAEIQDFLINNNLYFDVNYTKSKLLQVLATESFPKCYFVDELAKQKGHFVLRLPPYYCIFNPIELIWSQLKRSLCRNNKNPRLTKESISLIKTEIANISQDIWRNCINHVISIENTYIDISNSITDKFIINITGDESDTDYDEGDIEIDVSI